MKREYIRHPVDIPIVYYLENKETTHPRHKNRYLNDISHGGLSFVSKEYIKPQTRISIQVPIIQTVPHISAIVIWCKKRDEIYHVGVKFLDPDSEFKIRMVEQLCYIEQFKQQVFETEGRNLSGEEAAMEWIKKYANSFPQKLRE
ncbi:MAG: PilZ domain-containing protein [Chitinivibrionales bacterium]|nr:PilZ domain-containing protein [Chitinivibrionales bacterium]